MGQSSNSPSFLRDGGEMGELIRKHDWSKSSLGQPDTWPQSLRLTIRLMLNTQHPMFIWWGPDLIQFYNDAYRTTMGPAMHPMALGAKGRESWAEIWPIIGPQIEHVLHGRGATWNVEQMVPINRTGTPENVWWTYGYSPIDLEGGVGGVLVVCTDVTQQHLLTEAMKHQNRRLEQLFEQATGFMTTLRGSDHIFEFTNASYRKLLGGRDMIGKSVREAVPEAAGQGFIKLLDDVYRTGEPFFGRRTPIELQADPEKPPELSYLDFIYQAIREADGSISGVFVEGQDITDHVRAEEKLELINGELQHRVKNTLAMVQAIASQTLQAVDDREPVETLLQRFMALGRAHDALIQQDWTSADMEGAINSSVDAFALAHRFEIGGPSVRLGPSAALSLSMIVHELTTNAIKHGSLSVEEGKVHLDWAVEKNTDGHMLILKWTEHNGPAAKQPQRTGFGTKLVNMGLDGTGGVETRYDTNGFSAEIRAPLDQLQRK